MKKIIVLLFFAFLLASCGLYNYTSTLYSGEITYYMPDGTQEVYKATQRETTFNGETTYSPVTVDYGKNRIMRTEGIPYRFIAEPITTSHVTNANPENSFDTVSTIEYTYKGVVYEIPQDIWHHIEKLCTSNGVVDKKRCETYLADYIENIVKKEQKYKDGLYQY